MRHDTWRNVRSIWLLAAFIIMAAFDAADTAEPGAIMENSLGMRLAAVPAGTYLRGGGAGDYDEMPAHRAAITQPFYLGVTPVTNAQYEQFDPNHRQLRGKRGFSLADDEAVVFVSWDEAHAFCEWLSAKEGKPYRLPTEAEWEYACRAGTDTAYYTGDTLPKVYHRNQKIEWDAVPVSLRVGTTPPNAWGLQDMHGLVEEWCLDWYGPYMDGDQTDPAGYAAGESKVTRGGSHGAELYYLRSANRSGALPSDKNWIIGFRVVQGPPPSSPLLPPPNPPRWAQDVRQETWDWSGGPAASAPFFLAPIPFVKIPPESNGPLFSRHNHCPDITPLPNGDLFATWYTTNEEQGRELAVAAARFRRGATEWDDASLFFKVPDKNMHATAIWWDRGGDTIFHFQGVSVSYGWANLALFLRRSTDNGVTWSAPHWINREHGLRNMPIAGAIKTAAGVMALPCDAVTGGNGGSAIHLSDDGGVTWREPGADTPAPEFAEGASGGTIAGIHAGMVEIAGGHLLALGRGDTINGRMPKSLSSDMGKTWTYSASPFPPISGGQRLALLRLAEGPLFFAAFTGPREKQHDGMTFTSADGSVFTGHGLYAALSFDDGETWPVRKLITPGDGVYDGGGHTKTFEASPVRAEHGGYLAATQSPDGVIHLISSKLHYRFNMAWVTTPPSAP